MRISGSGIDLIKKYEGCRLEAYKCSADVWTIGIGHTRTAQEGLEITKDEAVQLLQSDLYIVEEWLNSNLVLKQNQYDAICSLIFNIGIGAFERSNVFEKINQNRQDLTIADDWIEFRIAGGQRLRGLMLRRFDELMLYFS